MYSKQLTSPIMVALRTLLSILHKLHNYKISCCSSLQHCMVGEFTQDWMPVHHGGNIHRHFHMFTYSHLEKCVSFGAVGGTWKTQRKKINLSTGKALGNPSSTWKPWNLKCTTLAGATCCTIKPPILTNRNNFTTVDWVHVKLTFD